MKFLKNLKVKSKLRIPIIFLLILLIVFIYFYFNIDSLIKKEKQDKAITTEVGSRLRQLSCTISDWMVGEKTYDQFSAEFTEVLKLVKDSRVFDDPAKIKELAALDNEFKTIDTNSKEKAANEKQIYQLLDAAVRQSDEFFNRLDNRTAIPAAERSAAAAALLNTRVSFKINELLQQTKTRPEQGSQLISFLDTSVKEAESEEQRLANTPFAEFPKKTRESLANIKGLAEKLIENQKTINQYRENVLKTYKEIFAYFNQLEDGKGGLVVTAIHDVFDTLFFVILGITLLVVILSFILSKLITVPIQAMTERAYDLAVDEVDMTKRLEAGCKDEIGELAGWFNKFLERLQQLIIKVKNSSLEVVNATEEIAADSENLSTRTNEQAASISETSTTLEQFSATVHQNTEDSAEADMMLAEFNTVIQEKGSLINNVTRTMNEISDSSKEIDNIIKVINDISFQTNLLALNAAVEAARAGEAGRGFAVVASEVRNLAQKTAESSKSIQEIVIRNVETTQKGMELVKSTSEFFAEIVEVMGDTVKKVANITNVSREQITGIDQINEAISQMETRGAQNAQLVEQLSGAGQKVKANALELQELVARFKTDEKSEIKGSDYFSEVVKKKAKKQEKAPKEEEKKPKREEVAVEKPPTPKAAPAATEEDFFGAADEEGFEEF